MKTMANNEIKTNAEIYREQRKERLAKAAKKKSNSKTDKIIRIAVKTLSIVLVVAIVLFGALKMLTDVFCVPQKVLSAATYGDLKLSVAEYNYYYMSLYNQAAQYSQQLDQQYSGMGANYFSTTTIPSEQEYNGGEIENEKVETWADYFKYYAHERGFLVKILYNEAMSEEAKKAGFEITKEQQEEIDTQISETIDTLSTYAKQYDYALDNYIAKTCGEGLTEKSYSELIERDAVAQYYLSWYQENESEKVTDEAIANYYKEHRDEIDVASMRYFTVSYAEATEGSTDEVYTKEQAKARADKFAKEATTSKKFIAAAKKYAPDSYKENYADASATLIENVNATTLSGVSEKMSEWVMSTKRAKGDIAVFDASESKCYYIVLITSPAKKDTSTAGADVRHLLVEAKTTTTNSQNETVSLSEDKIEQNFKTAKKEAETLLKQWKEAGETEEKFIEFVKNHSQDPGSAETGGLYEDITSESNYVPEFLEWSLAPHKKGDTGLVKTDYGYHIMYFVGADETQKWESDVRTAIGTDAYNDYFDGLFEKIEKESELKEGVIDFFAERIENLLNKNVESMAASSASSSISY